MNPPLSESDYKLFLHNLDLKRLWIQNGCPIQLKSFILNGDNPKFIVYPLFKSVLQFIIDKQEKKERKN